MSSVSADTVRMRFMPSRYAGLMCSTDSTSCWFLMRSSTAWSVRGAVIQVTSDGGSSPSSAHEGQITMLHRDCSFRQPVGSSATNGRQRAEEAPRCVRYDGTRSPGDRDQRERWQWMREQHENPSDVTPTGPNDSGAPAAGGDGYIGPDDPLAAERLSAQRVGGLEELTRALSGCALPPTPRVLEVGCGAGAFTEALLQSLPD